MEKFALIVGLFFVGCFVFFACFMVLNEFVMRMTNKNSKLFKWWNKHICTKIE